VVQRRHVLHNLRLISSKICVSYRLVKRFASPAATVPMFAVEDCSRSKLLLQTLFHIMESISIGDSVTDKIVRQLTEDSEAIQQILDYYQSERTETVKAQNLALAAYDAEIKAIEDSVHRHLRYRMLSSACY
jgi:hypothetical protein